MLCLHLGENITQVPIMANVSTPLRHEAWSTADGMIDTMHIERNKLQTSFSSLNMS